jgi:putative aminopeptidase FrvX
MRQLVAPYHERAVRDEAERICREHGLRCMVDRFGNLLIRCCTAPARRPLVLAAHMDHPGFEIVRRISSRRLVGRFLGRVPEACFRPGTPVRLMPGAAVARLARRLGGKDRFEIRLTSAASERPQFAVWELEDFAIRRGRIVGRACDDLVGCAAVLATLIELKRRRARVNVIGVLSRAEEVGFRGALTLAAGRRLPIDALILSLETSQERPPVRQGRGVIVRVGDKASVFDVEATRFLQEVAAALQARAKGFQFQRALMSGGTCEATAYQEFGFQCTAVCVALGNYHNCGPRQRIAAEHVSLRDAGGMVDLLVAAAGSVKRYPELVRRLPRRLERLWRQARQRLTRP